MHRELSRVTNGSAESNEARENSSDQTAIRFSFIFDRLKGRSRTSFICISHKAGKANKTIRTSVANL